MATLKQIADKVGVSITTVSRVLNNDLTLSVSDDIRGKIQQTARNLQYKTPRHRMHIKPTKGVTIAIIHWYDVKEEIDDPYYMQIRRGIEQLALKSGISTILVYKNASEYNIDDFSHVQGLICVGKFSKDQIKQFDKVTSNIVFVDSSPCEERYDSVVLDFNKAVTDVLDLLILKGYQSIGYIGGVEYVSTNIKLGERREQVFKEYLNQKDMLEETHVHIGKFNSESGYELMKGALMSEHADAYFCANDSIALGVLRAIHEKGYKVPEDIGIVGFNDSPNSEYTYPPLTTVHVNTEFMGEQALISVMERIDGRSNPIKKVIPTSITIRKTIK